MTEENKNYIKSYKMWYENQKVNIEQIEANKNNSEHMVNIHKRQLKLCKEQLEHENKFLKEAIESFNDWCETNGFESDKL